MSEKALLKEIEKEQQKEVEKKLASLKAESEKLREEDKPVKKENRKTIFSASSFPAQEVEKLKEKYQQPQEEQQVSEDQEINKIESKVSQVIEKPNYDYMESLSEKQRKKIFSIKKEETAPQIRPQRNKFKTIVVTILFAIFGVWGIVNIASINNVSSQIAEVSTEYELNLVNYLKNLYTLDATNSENMKNLFETIPEEETPPTEIKEKSNWFDRICNFLEGLFGG